MNPYFFHLVPLMPTGRFQGHLEALCSSQQKGGRAWVSCVKGFLAQARKWHISPKPVLHWPECSHVATPMCREAEK